MYTIDCLQTCVLYEKELRSRKEWEGWLNATEQALALVKQRQAQHEAQQQLQPRPTLRRALRSAGKAQSGRVALEALIEMGAVAKSAIDWQKGGNVEVQPQSSEGQKAERKEQQQRKQNSSGRSSNGAGGAGNYNGGGAANLESMVQFPVLFEEGWTDKALYLERVRSLWGQLMGNNSTGSINIGSNIHGSSTGAGGGGGGGSNETSLYCHERGSVKEARRFSRGSGGQHRQWSATQSGAMVQPAWVTLKATAFQHVLLCTLNSIN